MVVTGFRISPAAVAPTTGMSKRRSIMDLDSTDESTNKLLGTAVYATASDSMDNGPWAAHVMVVLAMDERPVETRDRLGTPEGPENSKWKVFEYPGGNSSEIDTRDPVPHVHWPFTDKDAWTYNTPAVGKEKTDPHAWNNLDSFGRVIRTYYGME